MDDKIFDLLEKMYVDLTGKIDGIDNEMQEMKKNCWIWLKRMSV